MPVNQGPMASIKKVAKFFWRHCFTLTILAIGFAAFMEGPLNWKNGLYMTIAAVFLDWAKQFKLTPNPNRHHSINEQFEPLHVRYPWDSSIPGTTAYFLKSDYNRYN